jgi:hypothetical protein
MCRHSTFGECDAVGISSCPTYLFYQNEYLSNVRRMAAQEAQGYFVQKGNGLNELWHLVSFSGCFLFRDPFRSFSEFHLNSASQYYAAHLTYVQIFVITMNLTTFSESLLRIIVWIYLLVLISLLLQVPPKIFGYFDHYPEPAGSAVLLSDFSSAWSCEYH